MNANTRGKIRGWEGEGKKEKEKERRGEDVKRVLSFSIIFSLSSLCFWEFGVVKEKNGRRKIRGSTLREREREGPR